MSIAPLSTLELEIQMHGYRLMRSGKYKTAKEIAAAVKEAFPDAADWEISVALSELARRLIQNS